MKVPATALSDSVLRCFTPPAERAGARNVVRLVEVSNATGAAAPSSLWTLAGDARWGVGDGGAPNVLRLTHSPFTACDPVCTQSYGTGHELGTAHLSNDAFAERPLRSWAFDFELRMGGPREGGGDGFSINYGELPEQGIGELGGGAGLRIVFRTYVHNEVRVVWKNIVRHAVPYEKLRQEEHGMGRGEGTKAHLHRFARVVIRFDSQLLQLWYNGDKLIDGLRCEWYEPEAHWTWALGARTGQRADDHFLRNLTMVSSDYALDPGAITLEVSLNDQDYTGPDDYTAEAAAGTAAVTPRGPFFDYYGAPRLDGFSPTSGPTNGGTVVTLEGAELDGGLQYTCRFGNAGYPLDTHAGYTDMPRYSRVGDPMHNISGAGPGYLTSGREIPWSTPPAAPMGAAGSVRDPQDPYAHYARLAYLLGTAQGVDGAAAGTAAAVALAAIAAEADERALIAASAGGPQNAAWGIAAVEYAYQHDPYVDRRAFDDAPPYNWSGAAALFGSGNWRNVSKAVVPASFVQDGLSGYVRCVAPPSNFSGVPHEDTTVVALELALNAQDYTAQANAFTWYAPPNITAISPASGPSEGGTLVRLYGIHFVNGSDYRCAFGANVTAASFGPSLSSVDELLCVAPAQTSTTVRGIVRPLAASFVAPLELTLNGQQYTADGYGFSVYPPLHVAALSPASGPRDGHTEVTVAGGPFYNGTDTRCRFCTDALTGAVAATVAATVLNRSAVLCVTPATAYERNAAVEVTLNGQQHTSSAVAFEYTAASIVLHDVSPTTGPEHGRTLLTVRGAGIRDGAHYCCRFEAGTRNASYNGDVAADGVAGGVPHFVAPAAFANNGTYPTWSWSYAAVQRNASAAVDAVQCLTPAAVEAAPNGDETLTAPGATAHASRGRRGIPLTLTVATNCQQYSQPNGGVAFAYFGAPPTAARDALVSSISPSSGPSDGDTNVTLFGGPFHNGSDYRCRYGATLVTATPGVAGDTLHCQTPTHPNKAGVDPTPVALEVTLNGQQHSSAPRFEFYGVPRVSASSPVSGPLAGGTFVTIETASAVGGSHRLCRFTLPQPSRPDELRGVRWIGGVDDVPLVGATTDASVGPFGDTLLCASPVWPGNVTQPAALEVSLNGQQFTTDGLRYDFSRPPTIDVVYPLDGPAAGGTHVLLTGTEFHDFAGAQGKGWGTDLRCRFGELLAPTTLVEETKVRCVSPPLEEQPATGEYRVDFAADALPNASQLAGDARIADGVLKLTAASEFQTGSFAFALPYVTEVPTSFEVEFDAFIGGGTSPLDDPHRLDMAERDYEPIGGNGLALVYGILTSQPYDRGLNYRDLHRPHVVRTTATGGPTTVMADGTPYPGMKNPKAPPTYIPDGNTIRPGAGAGEYVNSGVERVWDAAAPGWAITRATETVGFYSSQQTSSWNELEPFGEFGPRGGSFVGLRLSLLTYTARLLEVAWRPAAETELQVLATVPLGASLRVLSWVGVRLAMTPAGRLDVWYDGTRYVHELEVPGFRAAVEKRWEWGFGASTHRATDHHWVDNVVLSSFALAKPTAYPLSLTLNRQQFYNASATFAYRPPPVISAVHPRSGPRAGATAVTLYGANLEGAPTTSAASARRTPPAARAASGRCTIVASRRPAESTRGRPTTRDCPSSSL